MVSRPPLPTAGPAGLRSIPVPWGRADDLHYRLRKGGLPTTLCLDFENRVARIEPWPGVSAEAVLVALAALQGPGTGVATGG